jgi:type II secretory pathway pseudopilin PulG
MRTQEHGFTILEVVIAAGILGLVLLVLVGTTKTTSAAQEQIEVRTRLESDAHQTLSEISRRLRGAGLETLTGITESPEGSTSIAFRRISGTDDSGLPEWDLEEQIRFEAPPPDSRRGNVVWVRGGRERALPGHPTRLRFHLDGRRVRIEVVAEARVAGGAVMRLERTSLVSLRN